jgi:Holliday junction resolvase
MRYAARTDSNHREIAEALTGVGCSVQSLHRAGEGVPDLLVGRGNRNLLVEIKTASEGLNTLQVNWHRWWRGQVAIARTVDEALRIVGARP